jgi:hypothetical protein
MGDTPKMAMSRGKHDAVAVSLGDTLFWDKPRCTCTISISFYIHLVQFPYPISLFILLPFIFPWKKPSGSTPSDWALFADRDHIGSQSRYLAAEELVHQMSDSRFQGPPTSGPDDKSSCRHRAHPSRPGQNRNRAEKNLGNWIYIYDIWPSPNLEMYIYIYIILLNYNDSLS